MSKSTRRRKKCKSAPQNNFEFVTAGTPLALFAFVALSFDLLNLTVRIPAVALMAVIGHIAGLSRSHGNRAR